MNPCACKQSGPEDVFFRWGGAPRFEETGQALCPGRDDAGFLENPANLTVKSIVRKPVSACATVTMSTLCSARPDLQASEIV
ncbi:hypothetical protein CHL67_02285 [Prosthecochloris sp. GSB1]|nr:hypothetical protein CHL67_02285 [Prosthecochloris sp. GSB1]